MSNLLKSDFYRLFRSRTFYICTFIASLMMFAVAFLEKWSDEMLAKAQKIEQTLSFRNGVELGLEAFSGGDATIFIAILTAVFVTSEFVHGTMKNAVSKGFSKIQIYLSKVITMTVATFILIFCMFVFGTISGTMVSGNFGDSSSTFVWQALRMVGIELLLQTALTSLFVMIAMVVRNNGGTIAINFIAVISFGPMIYVLLDYIFKPENSLSNYGLQNNIFSFSNALAKSGDEILRSILVGVAYLVVTTFIGMSAFKKSDI